MKEAGWAVLVGSKLMCHVVLDFCDSHDISTPLSEQYISLFQLRSRFASIPS